MCSFSFQKNCVQPAAKARANKLVNTTKTLRVDFIVHINNINNEIG
jgi:hypothetical protein